MSGSIARERIGSALQGALENVSASGETQMQSAAAAVQSNRQDNDPANDVVNPKETSKDDRATNPNPRSQPPATSLSSSLKRVLAAREALLHELDQGAKGIGQAEPKHAVTPSPKPAQPATDVEAGPVSVEPAHVTGAAVTIQHLEAERADLAGRLEQSEAQAEELRRVLAERDQRISILESRLREIEAARAQSPAQDQDSAQIAEMERQHEALAAAGAEERRQLVEEVGSLTRQIAQLRERYESQIAEMASQLDRRTDWIGRDDSQAHGSNGNQAAAEPAQSPTDRSPAAQDFEEPQAPLLLLVDDSEIGRDMEPRLEKFGFPTIVLRPGQEVTAQFQNRHVVCMALNLGLPSTWRVLRKLRMTEATVEAPIVAYILAPRSDTGYWFGAIDFVTLPLEYNDLIASLQRLAQPLKHVILIGMDDKLASRVRNQLSSTNVSVTAAQDRRSALDCVRGKYPQAAVVYPANNPVDGFRAIAGVRGLAIFKDLPAVFLLDPVPMDHEDDRLSAGARTLLRLGALQSHELIDRLASAMNASKSSSDSTT
jgi:CheY-like chemotaxis protein